MATRLKSVKSVKSDGSVVFSMKRGTIDDIGYIGIFIVTAIIAFSVYYYVHATILVPTMENFFTNQTATNATVAIGILHSSTNAEQAIGNSIPLLLFGMMLVSLILAFFIPSNPIFFPISLILGAIYIFFGNIAGNLLYTVLGQDIFNSVVAQFPLFATIADYLPLILGVFWFLLVVINYSNPAAGSQLRRTG